MIEVENLSFCYAHGSEPAVRDLHFDCKRGEIFGFLGPSGAGKSTTQRILTGLLKPYTGRARVFGKDVAQWRNDYYERIGVSFELPNHFLKLSGRENLDYFRALYAGPTRDPAVLLAQFDLDASADQLVGNYSKGMMTRLGLARALLHEPELLFLDEPTAGLDPRSAARVKEMISAQRDTGTTIFLTTHDMQAVDELCDRVAFIVAGQIELIDTPRALKLAHGRAIVVVEHIANGRTQRAEFALAGLGENREFLALLNGGQVQTVHSQEASLDDIFIRVTGTQLS